MKDAHYHLLEAFFGIGFPAAGVAVSLLSAVEQWLRIASLLVGIAAGIVSIVSIARKLRKE
jgi:hypothetical protein